MFQFLERRRVIVTVHRSFQVNNVTMTVLEQHPRPHHKGATSAQFNGCKAEFKPATHCIPSQCSAMSLANLTQASSWPLRLLDPYMSMALL